MTTDDFDKMVQIGFGVRLTQMQAATLNANIASLRARLAEATEVLREVEWADNSGWEYHPACPSCDGTRPYGPEVKAPSYWGPGTGHTPDCRLARVLKGEP